mgnify:CR=1 FL=1|tara:strand:- start:1241 stop:1483 length:243 start_codon:yes stop_codon:yes gene_type:complete
MRGRLWSYKDGDSFIEACKVIREENSTEWLVVKEISWASVPEAVVEALESWNLDEVVSTKQDVLIKESAISPRYDMVIDV